MNDRLSTGIRLSQSEKKLVYDEIYSEMSGYHLAAKAKDLETVANKDQMIYGEILHDSLVNLFQKIDFGYGMNFYDLGSGIGNVICLAAMEQKFDTCIGIEIFSSLIKEAITAETKLREKCNLKHPDVAISKIEWIHSNIMDISFPIDQKCCVFIHSTGFDEILVTHLQKVLGLLCKDSIVVSLTRPFLCKNYSLIDEWMTLCSWGETKLFIQKKEKDL